MKKIYNYLKKHPKFILAWIIVSIAIIIMLLFEIDKKLIAIISLLMAWFTNAFIGIGTFISLIPIIGPIIVNIFSIPFFWLMNGIGYFSSAYAIKKGQQKELLKHRLLTFVLLIGIIIGYILGHLIPTV
tara:strand:- start:343 stop:729 length:387 start_codon:yes stop_codon:yes gene_type:complete